MASQYLTWAGNYGSFGYYGNWIPMEAPTPAIGQVLSISMGSVFASGQALNDYTIDLAGDGAADLYLTDQAIDAASVINTTMANSYLIISGNVTNYGTIEEDPDGSGSTSMNMVIQYGGILVNQGSLKVDGNFSNFSVTGGGTFENAGNIDVTDGARLVIQDMGVSTTGSSGTITLEKGGSLVIAGTTTSSVTFNNAENSELILSTPNADSSVSSISGFQTGDFIAIAGAVVGHNYQDNGNGTGTLFLTDVNGASLGQLSFKGTYTTSDFSFGSPSGGFTTFGSIAQPVPPVNQPVLDLTSGAVEHGYRDASIHVNGPNDVTVTVNGQTIHDTSLDAIRFIDGTVDFDSGNPKGRFVPDPNASAVARAYYTTLGRAPDFGGEQYWTNLIDTNQGSLQELIQGFYESPEFQAKYGDLDNAGFVNLLYQNVLHRAGDPGGLAAWNGALNSGSLTRPQVVLGFSESAENKINLFPKIEEHGIIFSGPAHS